MKIIAARSLGQMPVYDLSVDHEHHSYVHSSGVVLHNCAFVIANRPISEFIPTTKISGVTCTAYTATSVEASGGVKMDFLIVNSLKDLAGAIRLVQRRSGEVIPQETQLAGRRVPGIRLLPHKDALVDIWALPEDQDVFEDIVQGRTETVFQFNTPAAQQWMENFNHLKPNGHKAVDSVDALAAFTALDRPGPLDVFIETEGGQRQNMLVEFARRARGETPAKFIPEVLAEDGLTVKRARMRLPDVFEELLPETYGVMVYQEQLQKMYQNLTGCTGAEAEEFRSNVAKKKMSKVIKAHDFFISRAGEKIGVESASSLWDFFLAWGQYGFNKSHAVCYSIIGYACAFLKYHYPLEWWCAVLCNASKQEINEKFWKFCGPKIDLPDLSLSGANFEIQNERLRAPLSLLEGVGAVAHKEICEGAPYSSVDDFCEKLYARRVATAKIVKEEKTITRVKRDENNNIVKVLGPEGPEGKSKKISVKETITTVVNKVHLGRSAVNRGIVYKLIIAGAMDSLFPKTMFIGDIEVPATISDYFEIYEKALAKATKKKAIKNIDKKYQNLTTISRYQMTKLILPAYSANLVEMLQPKFPEQIVQSNKGGWALPVSGKQIKYRTIEELESVQLADVGQDMENERFYAAVCGYVIDQRKFNFGEDKEKEACELLLDVNGTHVKWVKWPERNTGKLAKIFQGPLKGSILFVVVSKYSDDRPFTVENIEIAVPPLADDEEDKDEKESSTPAAPASVPGVDWTDGTGEAPKDVQTLDETQGEG